MMQQIAILTDFGVHHEAYSLCRVVLDQVKMISRAGLALKVLVRQGFNDEEMYLPAQTVWLDPGQIAENVVKVTRRTGDEIDSLEAQMREALADVAVVLDHDLIYQPNLWKHHIAARRIAKTRSDLHWYHWVHSASAFGVPKQVGRFASELQGPFPNSTLVVMHDEEAMRKQQQHGYAPHQTVVVPNPIDFAADFHPHARVACDAIGLWDADVVAFYPARLDRGKQPEVVLEIFAALRETGWDARVIIADFHSTGGDKAVYRDELKALAEERGLPVLFTSDLPGCEYELPHKAITDLFEAADVLVHPSKSESDPLILPEAAWKRCVLDLNFDLPLFRQYQGKALLHKFSSAVDVTTGLLGATTTTHENPQAYYRHCAAGIAYAMRTNPAAVLHAEARRTRSLKAVWERHLWPCVARHGPLAMQRDTTAKSERGLASVIVPCYLIAHEDKSKEDELYQFTRICFESLREHVPNVELVVVDNGCDEDHPEWRQYLKDSADIYIQNEDNVGFPPAVNQGLAVATGDWLVVANNDLEFVHDWVGKAVRAWDERTGIISSHLLDHDPQMRVGREVFDGPKKAAGYFMGALWMMSRAIYEEIGGLDEGYIIGMYSDKSHVMTVMSKGYQAIKIGHVRHVGNATWGKIPNQNQIYLKNKERFESLWGPL